VPGTDASQAGAGSLAVRRAVHQLVCRAAHGGAQGCRVLDVGGGSGVWAVPLATTGCSVTVVEPSPDALASLARRAREAGVSHLVTGVQGDADSLADAVADASADVVLAHGVLEVVEDVPATLAALVAALAPAGALSVLVAGRAAAVLHRALAGRIADAQHVLTDPDGRVGPRDPLLRRFDVAGIEAALMAAGLVVQLVQGDAVVSDLVPWPVLETAPGSAAALAELELHASCTSPLREMASRLHAVATVAPRP
jgi:S-adenosylmethionine-dependent methyltransferase